MMQRASEVKQLFAHDLKQRDSPSTEIDDKKPETKRPSADTESASSCVCVHTQKYGKILPT